MKEWKLTSFDLFCLNMIIKGAWVYETAPDAAKLQDALRKLHTYYPQLGGYYNEDQKAVLYDETKAVEPDFKAIDLSQYSCSQIAGNPKLAWSLVKEYDIKGFKKGTVLPLSAVLATLKDGSVLYVRCAHALMDAHSFYGLMKQWAALYKDEEIVPMVVDQSLLPEQDALTKEETIAKVIENKWAKMGLSSLFTIIWDNIKAKAVKEPLTMEVSQEEIAKLKAATGAGANAVLSAIASEAVLKGSPNRTSFELLTTADLRGRFPGIDISFFGNCSQPFVCADEIQAGTLEQMARAIEKGNKAVLDSDIIETNTRLTMCSSHYSLPYYYFDAAKMCGVSPGYFYVNNQLKFRACELDFGTGLPLYAFPNQLPDAIKFWQPVAGGPVQIIFDGLITKSVIF